MYNQDKKDNDVLIAFDAGHMCLKEKYTSYIRGLLTEEQHKQAGQSYGDWTKQNQQGRLFESFAKLATYIWQKKGRFVHVRENQSYFHEVRKRVSYHFTTKACRTQTSNKKRLGIKNHSSLM